MNKKYILLTGGHTGIGLELTKLLLAEGHTLGLIVRNEQRKKDAFRALRNNTAVVFFLADLGKREDLKKVAHSVTEKWPRIDLLFNNAGVLTEKLYYSAHGNELHLEVNAISPYLLTTALLPLLLQSDHPMVVNTATGGLHIKKEIDIPAFKQPQKFTKLLGSYMDSKLVLVLLMNHLASQQPKLQIRSVHPGAIKTKMTAGKGMPFWIKPIKNLFFSSPEKGAQKLYEAAFEENFQKSGSYISSGKIRPMKLVLDDQAVEQLLS